MALHAEVTVLKPDASGSRASKWVVLDGRKVVKSAEVPDDPKGVKAGDQARRYIKIAVEADGGAIELEDVPVELSKQRA